MKNKINIKSIAILIIVIGFFIFIKLQFPIFKVTSDTMNPNFKADDYILVDGFSNTQDLKENDVCVFNYNGEVIISRIVGLPGDLIEIKDGELFINSIEKNDSSILFAYKIVMGNHSAIAEYDSLHKLDKLNDFGEYKGILNQKEVNEISQYSFVKSISKIVQPKGYEYKISEISSVFNKVDKNWSRDNLGPIKVPEFGDEIGRETLKETYYFVMGDNRCKSIDSRHIGFISSKDVVGKVIL